MSMVAACPSWWWWWWCWWTWQWWRWGQWGWCVHLWLWTQSEDLAGFPATALLYKLFPLLFHALNLACMEWIQEWNMEHWISHSSSCAMSLFFYWKEAALCAFGRWNHAGELWGWGECQDNTCPSQLKLIQGIDNSDKNVTESWWRCENIFVKTSDKIFNLKLVCIRCLN